MGHSAIHGFRDPRSLSHRPHAAATLELILLSFLISVSLAIPIGVAGATSPNGVINKGTLITVYSLDHSRNSVGAPFSFFVFVVLVWPRAHGAHLSANRASRSCFGHDCLDSLIAGRPDLLLESLWYLSLPVLTLSFVLTGPIIKMVRENVSQSMSLGFIQYGEAVGLSKRCCVRFATGCGCTHSDLDRHFIQFHAGWSCPDREHVFD